MNTTGLLVNLEITFWNMLITLMSRSSLVQWAIQKAYPFLESRSGMKNVLKFIVLIGAAATLVLSLLFARLASRASQDPQAEAAALPNAPVTEVDALPTGQRSILVVSADDLTAPKPQLLSIWLVLFLPPEPHLTLMPIYPSASSQETSQASSLASLFRLDPQSGRLDADFLQALRARNFWWSGYVLLDQVAQTHLLSSLSEGSAQSGDSASTSLTASSAQPAANPHLALLEQATWYQEMCWRASRTDVVAGLLHDETFTLKIADHIRSDFRKEQALTELKGLQIPSGGLFCEFPTLSVQTRASW